MSIAFSGGTYLDTTVASSTGTRQELINNIETKANTAGWTTISGSGTSNLLLQSVADANGLQIRLRCKDNSGNCVQLFLENVSGSLKNGSQGSTGQGVMLLPSSIKTWRFLGTKYWLMIYAYGNPVATCREFAWVGMPCITGLTPCSAIFNAGFLWGNAGSDTDTTARDHPRSVPQLAAGNSSLTNFEVMVNNSFLSSTGFPGTNAGSPRLFYMDQVRDNFSTAMLWHNDTAPASDVFIGWGATANTDPFKLRGQVYDCLKILDPTSIEQTATIDGHTYRNICDNAAGSNSNNSRGSLWLATS